MRLVNDTDFPATLERADFGTDERFAAVIWKLTYKILPGGALDFSDAPMPLHGDPIETPYGVLHGDIFLRKEGADLCVLGRVYRTQPATALEGPYDSPFSVAVSYTHLTLPTICSV